MSDRESEALRELAKMIDLLASGATVITLNSFDASRVGDSNQWEDCRVLTLQLRRKD